jgi:hypothetical protein
MKPFLPALPLLLVLVSVGCVEEPGPSYPANTAILTIQSVSGSGDSGTVVVGYRAPEGSYLCVEHLRDGRIVGGTIATGVGMESQAGRLTVGVPLLSTFEAREGSLDGAFRLLVEKEQEVRLKGGGTLYLARYYDLAGSPRETRVVHYPAGTKEADLPLRNQREEILAVEEEGLMESDDPEAWQKKMDDLKRRRGGEEEMEGEMEEMEE